MLDRWVEGYESDFEKLVAIQDQLRLFEYSVTAGLSDSESTVSADYLTTFLLETKAGYCQQFATAFALLARQLGYSSRVAVGFLPGDNLQSDPASVSSDTAARRGGVFSVRGIDAHAWPEVYFDQWDWVRFEPTPRSSDRLARAPTYTFPRSAGLSFGDIPSGPGPAGSRPGQAGRRGFQDQDRIDRGEAGALDTPQLAPVNDAWKESFRRFLTIMVLVGVLFLIAVPSLKQWRVARRYRRAGDPVATAAAAFAEFQFEAGELAFARARSESAMSFARRLSKLEGIPEGAAVRLARIYETAQYSSLGIGGNVAGEARRLAHELRSGLWRRASWLNRMGRLFSPARPLS